jgi:hypothetical protein
MTSILNLLLAKKSLAVFELVYNITKIDVCFHLGCISPHVLLYHVNHMVMSIAVEIVLLVPKLRVHVHSHNICADILLLVSNHFHNCLCFSNLSDIDKTQAVFVLLDLLLGCIYRDW